MAEKPRTFPKSHRLRSRLDFARAYDARVRQARGPLAVFAVPNDLPHLRLGLSVSRKVGTAVRRNRIKRLIREAFRLRQHDLPKGYDLVVVVRPHVPLKLPEYDALLGELVRKLDADWRRRSPAPPDKPRDTIEP